MTNIDDFEYAWTTAKDDYVLVNSEFGYGIVNQKTQMALCISDEALEDAVIEKMRESGNRVYESILEALPKDGSTNS